MTRAQRLMWALQNLEDLLLSGRNILITIEGGADDDVWVDVKVEERKGYAPDWELVELASFIGEESIEQALVAAGEGLPREAVEGES